MSEQNQTNLKLRRQVLAALLIAIGVAASPLSIQIGPMKVFPVQHLINVLGAILLGPFYNVIIAFLISLIRVSIGTGTILAFPGSMCGALLAGLLFKYRRQLPLALIGEVFGTGVIGALLAWPFAHFLLGKTLAVYGFIVPFITSSLAGVFLAGIIYYALQKSKAFQGFLYERG